MEAELGKCADCGRPLKSLPPKWFVGMRCLSCARKGNAGRIKPGDSRTRKKGLTA